MFFNTIGFRLSAIFCGVTMLLMTLASIFYYTHQRQSWLDSFQSTVNGFVENLAVNSAPLLLSEDEMQLSVLLATETDKPEVLSAGILDRNDNVIIHSDISRIGRNGEAYSHAFNGNMNPRTTAEFSAKKAIYLDGKKIGSIVMTADQSFIHQRIKRLRYSLLAAVSLFTITGCLAAVYVISYFLNPLATLRDAAVEVGQGNFSIQIEESGGKEIRGLAQSFNAMTQKVADTNQRIKEGYLQTVMALSAAVEAKDPYTRGHCDRVAYYAEQIARQLGIDEEKIKTTQLAARLHDVGKIGVNEKVLGKPGKLTEDEFAHIARHPTIAWRILEPATFLADVRNIVVMHHERFDGKGYPNGLSGNQISLEGRILALADCYDAMTTNRPYRNHLSIEKALDIIRQERGRQFDPEVVDAFFAAHEKFRSRSALDKWLENADFVKNWVFHNQPQAA